MDKSPHMPRSPLATARKATMIRAKPITVLVVDDEPRIRRFVRRALEQEGWGAAGSRNRRRGAGVGA